jgi:hypothetical protein
MTLRRRILKLENRSGKGLRVLFEDQVNQVLVTDPTRSCEILIVIPNASKNL